MRKECQVGASKDQQRFDYSEENNRGEEETPGAAGHPEPGSGHDYSKTPTVEEGPPVRKTDGVPGASGGVEIERQQ